MQMIDDSPTLTFTKGTYQLETEEAERVSVDQVNSLIPPQLSLVPHWPYDCDLAYDLEGMASQRDVACLLPTISDNWTRLRSGFASVASWCFVSVIVNVKPHVISSFGDQDAAKEVSVTFSCCPCQSLLVALSAAEQHSDPTSHARTHARAPQVPSNIASPLAIRATCSCSAALSHLVQAVPYASLGPCS